jgi:hypothetical protein
VRVGGRNSVARAKSNGDGRLNETVANLNQSTAILNQVMATFLARSAETDARAAETNRMNSEMFARIEQRFARIEAILIEDSRILQALPDVIRDKIGFKTPESQPPE